MANLYAEVDELNKANAKRMKLIGVESAEVLIGTFLQMQHEAPIAEASTGSFPSFSVSEKGQAAIVNTWMLSEQLLRAALVLCSNRAYPAVGLERAPNISFYEMYQARHGDVHYLDKWENEFIKAIRFAVRSIAKELVHSDERLIKPLSDIIAHMLHPRMSADVPPTNYVQGDLVWGRMETRETPLYAWDLIREEMAKSTRARKLWTRLKNDLLHKDIDSKAAMSVDLWLHKHKLDDWIDAKKDKAAAARRAALEVPPAKRVRIA